MFKRVQKRQRRKEKEEELGLDEDMKEVLGLQDTDSEESESSSDEGDSSQGGLSENESDEEDGQEDVAQMSEGEEEEEEEEDTESDEEDELPPMSVTEAVKNPLYIVSLDPDIQACILCTGKLLKNVKMMEVHKASKVSLYTRCHFFPCCSSG